MRGLIQKFRKCFTVRIGINKREFVARHHSLLWLLTDDSARLGVRSRQLIKEADAVFVSLISVVEIQIKVMLGRVRLDGDLLGQIQVAGCTRLDYNAEAANSITEFPELERHDQFDRMLIAQAKFESLRLLTADKVLLGLGLNFVVDARL